MDMYQKRKIRVEEKNNDSQKVYHQRVLTGIYRFMEN